MKLAVMSDIHCNFSVFTILVNDALRNGVTHFLFLGDLITDGYRGNDIIQLIKKLNGITIKGNREEYINNYQTMNEEYNLRINRKSLGYNSLSKETLEYIKNLEEKRLININGKKILMIHKIEDYDKLINANDFEICLYGHTHIPKVFKYKNKIFINPGSVGITYNNYFNYMILEFSDKVLCNITNKKLKLTSKLLNEIKNDLKKTNYLEENYEWSKLLISEIACSRSLIAGFMKKLNKEIIEKNITSEEYNKIFIEKLCIFLKENNIVINL